MTAPFFSPPSLTETNNVDAATHRLRFNYFTVTLLLLFLLNVNKAAEYRSERRGSMEKNPLPAMKPRQFGRDGESIIYAAGIIWPLTHCNVSIIH